MVMGHLPPSSTTFSLCRRLVGRFSKGSHIVFKGGECVLSRPSNFRYSHHAFPGVRDLPPQQPFFPPFPTYLDHRTSHPMFPVDLNIKKTPLNPVLEKEINPGSFMADVSLKEAKRLLKLNEIEKVKREIKMISEDSISYDKLSEICKNFTINQDPHEVIKTLEQSGYILMLGQKIFLHPEKIARKMNDALTSFFISGDDEDDSGRKIYDRMKQEKNVIDKMAEKMVRRELWCGFGFVILHILGLMRLTFWEYSWDIMEPICFFVTSSYIVAGYSFFLLTSREPCFEGIYQARFGSRQKKIMNNRSFDIQKFTELQGIYRKKISDGDSQE